MQKIINGLLYDTEDSELLYVNKAYRRQYYLAKNGHYFVLYNNGDIYPTTEENIKDILGQNDIEKYIELFGEPQEA